MNILIIGASGLVGGACFDYFSKSKQHIVTGTFRSFKSDHRFLVFDPLGNPSSLAFLDQKWDAIIFTAALTDVNLCEKEVDFSFKNTVSLTQLIVDKIKNTSAKLIYISTDYVFDGLKGPYYETDNVNPINVYGRHKLKAEEIIQRELSNFAIFRVTNVYGEESRGKNFVVRLIKQAKAGQRIDLDIPQDQFATPVYSFDIARSIELVLGSKSATIFHVAGTDYYNRFQLAQKVLAYVPGHQVYIRPQKSGGGSQSAVRPLRGGLVNKRLYDFDPLLTYVNVDAFASAYAAKGFFWI